MIHQEFLYAFTSDGKLWRGTYIDGVIGTMEEQVCDIPADKDDGYYTQAYMTMDGSIIYKIDCGNSSISTKAGKVYVFTKQDDDSWKLITDITSSNPATNQEFGVDMCMNADNSKIWVSQYSNGVVDRFDIATTTTDTTTLDANSIDPFEDGSLKHFWKLDSDAKDSVGDANGTVNSVTFANKHAIFEGTNNSSYIQLPNTINYPNMTITFLLTQDDFTLKDGDTMNSMILGMDNYITDRSYIRFINKNNACGISGKQEGESYLDTCIENTGFTENEEQQVVLTVKDTLEAEVFLDGVSIGTKTLLDVFNFNRFGEIYNPNSYSFDGKLKNVRTFNRVLTRDEIIKLYEADSVN
jgi:hypothetical protein